MPTSISPELWYTALTAILTSLVWIPYAMNRILTKGVWAALQNPRPDPNPTANWAYRMKNAHINAIENLVVFAVLATTIHIAGLANEMTAMAGAVFFISRAAHLVIYTLGIPVLRTIAFSAGFVCQSALALRILGAL